MRRRDKVMLTIIGTCTVLAFVVHDLPWQRLQNECGLDPQHLPRFDPATQIFSNPKGTAVLELEKGEAFLETRSGWTYLFPVRNLLVTTRNSTFVASWRGDNASITMKHGTACVFELRKLQQWKPLMIAKPGKPAVLIVAKRRKSEAST